MLRSIGLFAAWLAALGVPWLDGVRPGVLQPGARAALVLLVFTLALALPASCAASPDRPFPGRPSPERPSPGKPSPGKPSPGQWSWLVGAGLLLGPLALGLSIDLREGARPGDLMGLLPGLLLLPVLAWAATRGSSWYALLWLLGGLALPLGVWLGPFRESLGGLALGTPLGSLAARVMQPAGPEFLDARPALCVLLLAALAAVTPARATDSGVGAADAGGGD